MSQKGQVQDEIPKKTERPGTGEEISENGGKFHYRAPSTGGKTDHIAPGGMWLLVNPHEL